MKVKEAVELFKVEGKPKVIIAKFEDDRVAVCTEVDGVKRCYVTSSPQPAIYYLAQAFYAGIDPKLRVRKIYGEKIVPLKEPED